MNGYTICFKGQYRYAQTQTEQFLKKQQPKLTKKKKTQVLRGKGCYNDNIDY